MPTCFNPLKCCMPELDVEQKHLESDGEVSSQRPILTPTNWAPFQQEFAIFGLMAVCGGLMGALFNCLNKRLGCENLGSLENEGPFLWGGGKISYPFLALQCWHQPMPQITISALTSINWCFGARWFGIRGTPSSDNPFHKGIPGMQTTGPQTTNPNH